MSESLRNLTTFMMSFISSFDVISVVASGLFTVVNPNGIITLLAFVNNKPTFFNDPRSLPRNPSGCITLDSL